MKRKYSAIASAVILLLCGVQAFSQNGTRLIAYDAKTAGRGGTSTAFFDNPSLIMNNPAGLSFMRGRELNLSMSVMAPALHFKNSINNTDGERNVFPLGCLSFVNGSPSRFTYALGVFTQGGMGADFKLNNNLFRDQSGNFIPQVYHSKFAVMQGGASLAYKLSSELSVGATADLVYGQVEFQMPMAMPPSMLKGVIDPQTGFTFGNMFSNPTKEGGLGYTELVAAATMNGLKAFGVNGKIGIAYKPNERFSAGVSYSSGVHMRYNNGSAKMDMTYQMNDAFARVVAGIMQQNPNLMPQQAQAMAMGQFAQLGIDLAKGASDSYSSRATFGLPQSVSTGIFFSPNRKVRLALDVEWINWAKAFDHMDISLKGGTNPNINTMTASGGNLSMAFPLDWKNTVVIRTGGEVDITRQLIMRAGYVYGSNPVPESTVFPVFPAIVTHHITVGGTLRISRAIAVNIAWEYAFRNNETVQGQSRIASEYDNSTSSLANNIYHASVSWYLK